MRIRRENVGVLMFAAIATALTIAASAAIYDAIDQHNRLWFVRDLIFSAAWIIVATGCALLALMGDFSDSEETHGD